MNARSLRTWAAAVALAVVAGACGSAKSDHAAGPSTTEAGPGNTGSSGSPIEARTAELRANLTSLLQEHVYLAGLTTGTALAGQDSKPAAAVLDKNSIALADAVRSLFGQAPSDEFLALWRKHIGFFVDYTMGVATADPAKQQAAVAGLDGYRADFGAFIESATQGKLTKQAVADDLKVHVDSLLAAIKAQGAKSSEAFAKLQMAASHMKGTAAVLAKAFAAQAKLDGSTDSSASALRTTLTDQLQEHVYLAGIAVATGLGSGLDSTPFKAAADVLDKNSQALAASISSVYGPSGGDQFLALWRKHIGFFVDYARATAAKDDAAKSKAKANLDGYRADFGAFIETATAGKLTKQAVADELRPHVETLFAAIDAAAANSSDVFDKLQMAAQHMPMTAKILSGAVARQFPDKFTG